MSLESATHINDLNVANPLGSDLKSQGDDHIRLVKDVLKRDLPLTTPATALGISVLTAASTQVIKDALLPAEGYRNRIYNGDFSVAQKPLGGTIPATNTLTYAHDRFFAYATGGTATAQRQTFGDYFTFQLLGSAANTGVGIGTRLLNTMCLNLSSQACTLGVKIKTSVNKTITWNVYVATTPNAFGTIAAPTKTLVTSGTFSATSTMTQFSANFTAAATSSANGLEVIFTCPSLLAGETFEITEVQLEKGTITNSNIVFENVDPFVQFARCQRFYQINYLTARAYATIASQNIDAPIFFPVQMRATPTAAFVSGGTTANIASENVVGLSTSGARFSIQGTATGDAYAVDRGWSFSAEL